jgi:hypothetical protein
MNWLDKRDLPTHISVLDWLYIFGNVFFLVVAAFGFFLLPTIGAFSHNREVTIVLSVIGIAFGVLMVVLALPG